MNVSLRQRFNELTTTGALTHDAIHTLLDNCIVAMRASGRTGLCENTLTFNMWKSNYIQQLGIRPTLAVLYSIVGDMMTQGIFLSTVLVENPEAFHTAIQQGNIQSYYQLYR
jgi:hypothetical protein